MSYRAYPVVRDGDKWVKTPTARCYSLACVATVPSAVRSFKENGREGTALLYDMSDITKPEHIELANLLASVICSGHKHWYTHDSGLRSPVFLYDVHTYDDIFYAVSPFRQIMEYSNVIVKFFRNYPIDKLKTLPPRQVKRLWFTANRVRFNIDGTISLGCKGNNHSAFTLMTYCGDGRWNILPRAASQLINSDTYWRSRVSYPEGKKPKPFNKAGDIWTVALRDVSQCPTFANTAKRHVIKQVYNQDRGYKELTVNRDININNLPEVVQHCAKIYDDVIKRTAVKPPQPVKVVHPLEAFANTCKRRAA